MNADSADSRREKSDNDFFKKGRSHFCSIGVHRDHPRKSASLLFDLRRCEQQIVAALKTTSGA